MKIHFTKMHGIGNDFILIDCLKEDCKSVFTERSIADAAQKLSHRRFGIGADQILLLEPSNTVDFRMRILNADGSEVEMCGNGIRCLAKYIWDKGLSAKKILSIETFAGVIKPEMAGDMVKVDMGEPVLAPDRVPVKLLSAGSSLAMEDRGKAIIDYPLQVDDAEFKITCVSMGNPHAVIVVDDVSSFPVAHYGPVIETHPIFPRKTNVEFIQVLSKKEIKMRVWERGSGETMACGTGASGAAVAASLKGIADRAVTMHLLGGDLFIEWAPDNHVYMTGAAVTVFEGAIDL